MDPIRKVITSRIDPFCEISGLSRSRVYSMMADGRLEYVKEGKATLIIVNSWRRRVADKLADVTKHTTT